MIKHNKNNKKDKNYLQEPIRNRILIEVISVKNMK